MTDRTAIDCMKRAHLYIIYISLAAILLTGCKPEYPYIEYEGGPGNVYFDNIGSLEPIRVAIDNPFYESFTRGAIELEKEMGLIKDVYIYAFYTPEGIINVPDRANYREHMGSKDEENIYCLVDDSTGHGKKACIDPNTYPFLKWAENDIVYYSSSNPLARYRFFAYHIGDIINTAKPNRQANHVSYDIEIDGTQDLMCGYAQPTKEQLTSDKMKEELSLPSNKDFTNNLEELAYSSESARRGLIPVVEMKHQLVYLKFHLKADSITIIDSLGNMQQVLDPGIDSVRIDSIIIENVPFKGEFIVAAEDISRLGVTFAPDTTKDFHVLIDSLVGKPITEGRDIGGFLLPEAEKYNFKVIGKQKKREKEELYELSHELKPSKGKFNAGHKYEVVIKIHGLSDIDLNFSSEKWGSNDEIPPVNTE